MTGCVPTIKQSKIPSFLERLKKEKFSKEQKVIVGDLLHYVNDLETNLWLQNQLLFPKKTMTSMSHSQFALVDVMVKSVSLVSNTFVVVSSIENP